MTTTTTEQALTKTELLRLAEKCNLGHLAENDLWIDFRATMENVLKFAAALAATQSAQNSQVDWLGLALDLEQQAKRVESQTVERSMLAAAHGLRLMGAAQSAQPQESEMTDDERRAFDRFDKPEWAECSHFRLRVLLAVCHETITRCGAKIENLQDRVVTLEAATRRIRAAISTDSCDGDSAYADGVNAAVTRHTEGIDTILREARISLDNGEQQNG